MRFVGGMSLVALLIVPGVGRAQEQDGPPEERAQKPGMLELTISIGSGFIIGPTQTTSTTPTANGSSTSVTTTWLPTGGTVPLWVGVRVHPAHRGAGPFLAAGAEGEFYALGDGAGAERLVPELRAGLRVRSELDDGPKVAQLAPTFLLYGIAGYRLSSGADAGGYRFGFGLGSPRTMIESISPSSFCIPAPVNLEAIADFGSGQLPQTLRPAINTRLPSSYQVRWNWSF